MDGWPRGPDPPRTGGQLSTLQFHRVGRLAWALGRHDSIAAGPARHPVSGPAGAKPERHPGECAGRQGRGRHVAQGNARASAVSGLHPALHQRAHGDHRQVRFFPRALARCLCGQTRGRGQGLWRAGVSRTKVPHDHADPGPGRSGRHAKTRVRRGRRAHHGRGQRLLLHRAREVQQPADILGLRLQLRPEFRRAQGPARAARHTVQDARLPARTGAPGRFRQVDPPASGFSGPDP